MKDDHHEDDAQTIRVAHAELVASRFPHTLFFYSAYVTVTMYLHDYYMISAEIGPISVYFDMSGGISLQVGVQLKVIRLCAQARWCRCSLTSTCVFHYTCTQMLLKEARKGNNRLKPIGT